MELTAINAMLVSYFMYAGYQAYKFKDRMDEGAFHHFVSHNYIVGFFFVSINLYAVEGYTLPLLLTVLHVLQHIVKENNRLVKTGKWTASVSEG